MYLSFFLVYVNWCTVWEGYAVSSIQGLQVYAIVADARVGGYYGAYQFAMLSGIETGARKLVPPLLFTHMANLPYKVIE